MSTLTKNKIVQNENFRLPRIMSKTPRLSAYPTGLPSKEDLQKSIGYNIQNDLVPRTLETYIDSTKDFLKDETNIRNSKLVRMENGKYIFINEYGIPINKYGPFWPKMHKIFFPLPKFMNTIRLKREFYIEQRHVESVEENANSQNVDKDPKKLIKKHSQYIAEWYNSILIFDTQKSQRNQDPLVFAQRFAPTLVFESRFESGNLRQARRVGQFDYELLLRTDLFTERHTQWYFFKVSNMLPNVTYRFRIINLKKKNSLYNEGLMPLLYSNKLAEEKKIGWYRTGHHISYNLNKDHRSNPLLKRAETYYELEFQLEFPHEADECYLAHCYPYTYTNLKEDIDALEENCSSMRILQRDFLCETRAGNTCFLLTITDFNESDANKSVIVISARVHPGETNSSFIMRGIMEYLTSDNKIAEQLRKKVIFKIVPMLNPDGVIVGNYRCSLAAKDLNRNYRNPQKSMFPTVWHLKDLIAELKKQYNVFAYFDLHGHSRKSNVFTYGCAEPDPEAQLLARVLPWILAKKSDNAFSFENSRYHISKTKESTSRVVMWRQMQVKHCYTFEASFAGTVKVDKPYHFNIRDYENLGKHFCEGIHQFIEMTENPKKAENIYVELTNELIKNVRLQQEEEENAQKAENEKLSTPKYDEKPIEPCKNQNECLEMFKAYNQNICQDPQTSSDSDSESEPEFIPENNRRAAVNVKKMTTSVNQSPNRSKQRLSRKQTKSNNSARKSQSSSGFQNVSIPATPYRLDRSNSTLTPQDDFERQNSSFQLMSARKMANFPNFVNKYTNRSSNGIPIFTMERAEERMLKKLRRINELNSMKIRKSFDSKIDPLENDLIYEENDANLMNHFNDDIAELDEHDEQENDSDFDENDQDNENHNNNSNINVQEMIQQQPSKEAVYEKRAASELKRTKTVVYSVIDSLPVYNLAREHTIFSNISENDLKQKKLTSHAIDIKFISKLDSMGLKKPKHKSIFHFGKPVYSINLPSTNSHAKKAIDGENYDFQSKDSNSLAENSYTSNLTPPSPIERNHSTLFRSAIINTGISAVTNTHIKTKSNNNTNSNKTILNIFKSNTQRIVPDDGLMELCVSNSRSNSYHLK